MENKKMTAKTFYFSLGTTVTYFNTCDKCQRELGDPTRSGMLICPDCGEEKHLSLLGNKF